MNFAALLIGIFSLGFNPDASENGSIKIKLEGLKEQSGVIGLMLFNQEEGFPTEKEKAYLIREYKIDDSFVDIEIDDLPLGKYAVSVVHDLNENKDLDRNMLGIPTEPFGFSGNKNILFGLPKFEEAVIELDTKLVESRIELISLF